MVHLLLILITNESFIYSLKITPEERAKSLGYTSHLREDFLCSISQLLSITLHCFLYS